MNGVGTNLEAEAACKGHGFTNSLLMQQHLLEDRFGFRSTEHSIGPSSRSNGRTDHENELQVEKSHQVDQWSAIVVVVVVPYPTLHLLTHRIEHCSAGASRDERADRFYTLFFGYHHYQCHYHLNFVSGISVVRLFICIIQGGQGFFEKKNLHKTVHFYKTNVQTVHFF